MPADRRSVVLVIASCFWGISATKATCSTDDRNVTGTYFLEGVRANLEFGNGLKLDAYAPPGARRPAALLIHGSSGDKSTHLTQLFSLLTRAGYAWFSINYHRLGDIRAAVAFIESPGRFSIEPSLLVIGEDTGVSLALELVNGGGFTGVIGFGAAKNVAAMQDPHVPVTLFHGAIDVDSDPKPIESACRSWKRCRFELIPKGIHNLENWHPGEWEWKEEFTAILRNGRRGRWKDIVYARPGGLPLAMDAYLPEGPGAFPAVIVVHGGGWEAGDKVTYVSPVLALLSRTRFAWFSIDYRLTPYVHNEEQLEDLRNAIRYVRTHAARFGIEPNAIAVLGESASGQMVTEIASQPCSGCEVQAVVSFYGVYDFVPWASDPDSKPMLDRIFGSWDIGKLRRYSPISHVHRGMPPVLMMQGTADELYSGSVAYERQLKQEGVSHELILLDNAPHGMENWVGHPEWEFYQSKLVDWLNKVLRAGHRA
jgi:acetyl esterase